MKKILLLITPILLFGCSNYPNTEEKQKQKQSLEDLNYDIVIIEHCEYIVCNRHTSAQTLTHKGNCKNHSHSLYIR